MPKEENDIIPENESGLQTNTESSKDFDDARQAKEFYQIAKNRLLHVNEWQGLAGPATAAFQLTDERGKDLERVVQENDHFKIDIPGPGPITGEGYDWVKVEAIESYEGEAEEFTAITVRPATNPLNNKKDIAHFFNGEATSSFVVKREKNKVTAGVYGRNEKPNTNAEAATDKVRNTAVAAGAMSGFSKIQWKSLVNGFLKSTA
jgi:hypothetical protein